MSGFKHLVISGIVWNLLGQVGKQAIRFSATVVLLRLLTPDDFGMIAMVTVFTGFASIFSELGLGAALIQKTDVDERHYCSVFWLNLVSGFILTGVIIMVAPLISRFYDEPRLTSLVTLISINFALGPLVSVHRAILKKKMNFRPLAVVETLSITTASIGAVVLAWMGHGVNALVWQALFQTMISSVFIWRIAGWRPDFIFQWTAIRQLLRFSMNLMGLRFFTYWVRNADNLLIGKLLGSGALGFYSRAYSTMLLPLNQINEVLSHVMFPALSRIKEDKNRVKTIYLNSIGSISLMTFPMMVGLAMVSDLFVLALFGTKWEPMIPILRVLCVIGMLQSILTTTGWLYDSQGRTDLALRWGLIGGALTIVSFVIGIHWGAIGVAAAYLARILITLYFHISIPGALVGLTFWEVLKALNSVTWATLGMACGLMVLRTVFPSPWPPPVILVLHVSVGVLIYWCLVHFFKIKAYGDIFRLVRERRGGPPQIG